MVDNDVQRCALLRSCDRCHEIGHDLVGDPLVFDRFFDGRREVTRGGLRDHVGAVPKCVGVSPVVERPEDVDLCPLWFGGGECLNRPIDEGPVDRQVVGAEMVGG